MIPKDPVMRLSYVNTQLRDHYPSLTELCMAEGASKEELVESLKMIGYEYDEKLNQFR